ncbi:MAG: hypothetical protein V3575_01590 [Candidatus Absconditabacteria bacterium]
MKNLLYKFIFGFSMFFLFSFAHASVYIEGGDKQVSYGEYVNLVGNIGDIECIGYEYDWSLYGGDIWLGNNSQTLNLLVDNDYEYVMFKLKCNRLTHVDEIVSSPIRVTMKPPVVNAGGSEALYSPGQLVNLNGSISGTPCSVFSYYWEQVSGETVEIENHEAIEISSSNYSGAKFVYPSGTDNITLKLRVRPSSCYHSMETFSGTVTYYRNTSLPPTPSPSVSISGGNQTILPNSSINLQGVLNNINESNCSISYKWGWVDSAVGSIDDYYSKSIIFTAPEEETQIDLKLTVVVTNSGTTLCESAGVYDETTTIWSKLTSSTISQQGGGEKIDTNKLKAQEFLNNKKFLKEKVMSLNYDEFLFPILNLHTDNLQANGYIEYIFEYSTGINFDNPMTIHTMGYSTYIYPKMFDKNSLIHLFRVKACMDDICTQYSPVLNYINPKNPINIYQVSCNSCKKPTINYLDILDYHPDILIEKFFKIYNCKGTCKMPDYLTSKLQNQKTTR